MFDSILFYLSATLTLGGGFAVLISKNLVHACIYLLASFFGIAGLYATLGADFLAATQLVVYAGGVIILMLFAIMLTGGVKDAVNRFGIDKTPGMGSTRTYVVAGLMAIITSMIALKIIAGIVNINEATTSPNYFSTVEKIGTLLITDHILAFEISSILLLGALVGAAVIARPRS